MRKSVLAIAAAGSIFSLTAAGAGTLSSVTGGTAVSITNSKTITVSTTNCNDPMSVAYTRSGNTITAVVVTIAELDKSTCSTSNTVAVSLSNSGATQVETGSATAFTGTTDLVATVSLGTAYNMDTSPLASTALTVA